MDINAVEDETPSARSIVWGQEYMTGCRWFNKIDKAWLIGLESKGGQSMALNHRCRDTRHFDGVGTLYICTFWEGRALFTSASRGGSSALQALTVRQAQTRGLRLSSARG